MEAHLPGLPRPEPHTEVFSEAGATPEPAGKRLSGIKHWGTRGASVITAGC